MKEHIIIAGFGRSGTTWMSDIISKSLGGLILFEPCHPEICKRAQDWLYDGSAEYSNEQKVYVNEIIDSEEVHPWLLRNHLRNPIEQVPIAYVNDVWRECDVIGYKTIRWNHNLSFLAQDDTVKVIYMLRNPLSVIASLLRREAYWDEFGWDMHWDLFLSRSLSVFPEDKHGRLIDIADDLSAKPQKIAYMWAVSTLTSLHQLEEVGGLVVKYEDLYLNPYKTTRSVLSHLEKAGLGLHPTYLFEPSMTTHRTFHLEKDRSEILDGFPSYFWKDTLASDQAESLLSIIKRVLAITQVEHKYYVTYGVYS